MKNLTWKTRVLIAIGVVTVLSVTSAYAQAISIRTDIPFQFIAAGKVLPAGQYQLEYAAAFQRITLRATGGGAGMYLTSHPTDRPGSGPQPGMFVFHKYGDHYFLWKVWSPGHSQGYELPASKAEREMARMLKTQPATETVSVGSGPE
jgi:hypothetical protein